MENPGDWSYWPQRQSIWEGQDGPAVVGEGSHCLCRAQEATSGGAGLPGAPLVAAEKYTVEARARGVVCPGWVVRRAAWAGAVWAFPGLVLPPHPSTRMSQCPQTSFSAPCAERPVVKGPGSTLAKLGTERLVPDRPGPPSGCRPLGDCSGTGWNGQGPC